MKKAKVLYALFEHIHGDFHIDQLNKAVECIWKCEKLTAMSRAVA